MPRYFLPLILLCACGHPAAVTIPATPAPTVSGAASPRDVCDGHCGPAFMLLRAFRAELWALAATNPTDFESAAYDRYMAFRMQNRGILLEHAKWSLARLPVMDMPDLASMPDDPRMTPGLTARFQQLVDGLRDPDERGFRSFERLISAGPIQTFIGVRLVVQDPERVRSPEWRYENILERLAPTPIVRLNNDLDHPVLAFPRRGDCFVMWLDRDRRRETFVPARIRWVRQNPPAEPRLHAERIADIWHAYAMAMQATPFKEGETELRSILRLVGGATPVAERRLRPYAKRLLQDALDRCAKLPHDPMPGMSGWEEVEGLWPLPLVSFVSPALRWDPLRSFFALRELAMGRAMSMAEYERRALVDSLAPTMVSRANTDPNHPVLFLADRNDVFIVEYSLSPERGLSPTRMRYFRRANPGGAGAIP